MGRPHRNVVAVVAHDEAGHKIGEDIVPRPSFAVSGSLLLNSAAVRARDGIRMISVRVFDELGVRVDSKMRYFGPDGAPVEGLHRRPDGTIIDTPF
jgi:hypothetical protein